MKYFDVSVWITYLGQQQQTQMWIEGHASQEGSYGSLTPIIAGPSRWSRSEKGLGSGQCVVVDLKMVNFGYIIEGYLK